MRKLSGYSNVIPLISKADTLSREQIISLKRSFIMSAQEAGIRPFLSGDTPPNMDDDTIPYSPFAVSSANSSDDENMDASLLMSPDYVRPLVPSELGLLLEKMFDRDKISWLRHSAAKKLIQTRDHHAVASAPSGAISRFSSLNFASSVPPVSPSQVLVSYPTSGGPSGYTMARVADHTQREEQLAQVRLAKWASDLQRSLQNERQRYEALARGERAIWLTERLSECVVDGTLLPLSQTPGFCAFQSPLENGSQSLTIRRRDGRNIQYRVANLAPNDPLGLIRWNDDLRRRGWILVQVIGSFGVVGGLALWIARTWGFPSQGFSEWNFTWITGGD